MIDIHTKWASICGFSGIFKIVNIFIFSVKWSDGVCKISNDVSFIRALSGCSNIHRNRGTHNV